MFCASDWLAGHFGRLRRRERPAACAIGSPPRRRPGHAGRWLLLSSSRHRNGRCDTSPPSGAFPTVIRRLPGRGRKPIGAGPLIRVCYAGREPERGWPVNREDREAAGQRRCSAQSQSPGKGPPAGSATLSGPCPATGHPAGAVFSGALRHVSVHSKPPSRPRARPEEGNVAQPEGDTGE